MNDALLDCVHCGLCLHECPTYRVSGLETESPRGRLLLMRAAAEGRLTPAEIAGPLDRCLQCRACEPICPSRVRYGAILERHREGSTTPLARLLLRRVLPSRFRLGLLGGLARLARRSGLLGWIERSAGREPERGRGLAARLRALASAVPARPRRWAPRPGTIVPAAGTRRGRIALHLGCANAELLGATLRDVARLLALQGYDVVVPRQPACCGALHAHSGDAAGGAALAAATAAAFRAAGAALGPFDAILVPAAGCLAHLIERAPGAGFAEPLLFLHERGLTRAPGPLAARVAYDPPCHLRNVIGARDEIPALLRAVPGLELVPHLEAELCCGAGGAAFLREPAASALVAARKGERLRAARPSHVASGNPGCLLRLEAELRRSGGGIEVVHPATLLARACEPRP